MAKVFLVVSVLAATGASCFVMREEPREPAAEPAAAVSPEVERPIQRVNVPRQYAENCANCHGERGEGGGAGTKTLLTEEKYDQKHDRAFFDAIKNGVPDMGMAAFGSTWSDAEIWAQVVYIRELQGRALRQKNGGPKAVNGVYTAKEHKYRVEDVYQGGMSTPWSMDWLPDDRILITNRSGSMLVVRDGKLLGTVSDLPPSVELGQGGLMEVAVHPDYARNGWIYLSLADPRKDGQRGALTKIVRGKLQPVGQDYQWHSTETIYEADQQYYTPAGVHFGSKIVFDGKGNIFFSVGERGTNMRAQDTATPFGKVMRVTEEGKIPSDNPIAGNPMWSYGHRNQQGLVLDLEGNLWDTEHGPRGGDEINLIKKGLNYGWPVATYSMNYDGTPHSSPWPTNGLKVEHPVARWMPSVGASGLDVIRGNAFPKWKGDLIAGGLAGNNLDRYRMKDGKMVEKEELIWGMGRVRDIAVSKEGHIYVVLNGPDKVIRLVPAN